MGKRGAFILIEGLDRTGKSTQCAILEKKIPNQYNRPTQLLKFPDRTTPIGKLINSYLTDKQFSLPDESVHLLFSANRWELKDTIVKLLEEGTNVILDRYVYSGVAYSSAKMEGDSDWWQWCLNPDLGLPKPDLTIFLNLVNDISSREGYGDERYEVKSFQQKVKLQFEKFFGDENWRVLNVDGLNIEEVEAKIWPHVEPLITGLQKEIEIFK